MYSPTLALTSTLPLLLLSTLPPTQAWGTLGHQTIAWLAQTLISNTTTAFVQTTLDSSAPDFLPNISTWADTIRYTSGNRWTAPLHYIDANDAPPGECDIEYSRDCGESGCVVSAIVNYTSIILSSSSSASASASEKRDAMRFLVHFVGDLHQPLHVENLERGGNGINVTFDGDETNLHHIWDTEIPEKIAGDRAEDAEAWAGQIRDAVQSGELGDESAWVQGVGVDDVQGMAMGWAGDANGFVCTDVLPDGVEAVEEGDLGGAYFDAHRDVARLMIARAGWRLGALLDEIAAAAAGSEE